MRTIYLDNSKLIEIEVVRTDGVFVASVKTIEEGIKIAKTIRHSCVVEWENPDYEITGGSELDNLLVEYTPSGEGEKEEWIVAYDY